MNKKHFNIYFQDNDADSSERKNKYEENWNEHEVLMFEKFITNDFIIDFSKEI